MKKENVVLAASLLLNAGLIAFLALPGATAPARAPAERPGAVGTVDARQASAPAAPEAAGVRATKEPARSATTTSTADRARSSRAVRELVAELRRRGVDEGTVRRLGVAHAEREFRIDARALLEPRNESAEYWRPPGELRRFGDLDSAKLREFQRLRRERVAVLDELFGDVEAEATEHNTVNHYLAARGFDYDYAPPDKRLALTEFFEREMAGVGRTPVQRLLSQSTSAPKRELEQSEKVRGILGPDLFDDYLLRSSGIAMRLRYELTAFQPTRAEFDELVRAEYALLQEHSDSLAPRAPMVRTVRDGFVEPPETSKLEAARAETVREVLGDARYADFERATDVSYHHLDQLARELGMGPSAVRSAFAHIERARTEVLALSGDGNMSDPKVLDAMRGIRDRAQERIASELGIQDLSKREQMMILGPALNIHPRQVAQRMFRWN